MNVYSKLKDDCHPSICAIADLYLNNGDLTPDVKQVLDELAEIENITPLELEDHLRAIFCFDTDYKTVIFREKKLINHFWKELTPPDLTGSSVRIFDKKAGVKVYERGGSIIGASFGGVQAGQFGEFNHPLLPAFFIDSLGMSTSKKNLKLLTKELDDCDMEVPNTILHADGGVNEIFPIGLYGIKSIPITVAETDELQANNGTFSAEMIANHHYQRLVLEDCAFAPLFSSGSKIPFDKKIFSGDNMSALNRLQRTLKRIQKDAAIVDKEEQLWIAGNVVDSKMLDASIFSDKIGMFTTTWVGHSLNEPPILSTVDELVLIAIDAFWTMEQAIQNKIYITDLNIGNILHHNMSPWAHLAGWNTGVAQGGFYQGHTWNYAREYSWDDPKACTPGGSISIKVPNNFTRLVFVDLGTSIIENPSLGGRRIIDKNSPLSKNSRCDIIADCRRDLLSVINYLAIVNNLEEKTEDIVDLNVNKNLFMQLLDLPIVINLLKAGKDLEVAEKYHSKVFR